jgi:hypothetical protein
MTELQKSPPQLKPLERKTRPPRRGAVNTGGMISLATMFVSLATMSIAMGGGLILIFDILDKGLDENMSTIPVKLIVLGFAFLFGWGIGLVSIRAFRNRVYPAVVKLYAWGCVAAAGVLYIKVIQKLYEQDYDNSKLGMYVMMLVGVMFILLCLHLLLEEHDPRPLAIPLLIVSIVHVFVIVYHYVFDLEPGKEVLMRFVLGDFMILFLMITIPALILINGNILTPVRETISGIFSRDKEPEDNRNSVR